MKSNLLYIAEAVNNDTNQLDSIIFYDNQLFIDRHGHKFVEIYDRLLNKTIVYWLTEEPILLSDVS